MKFLMALAFAVLILIEVPGFIKKKQWRELTVYSVLMVLAIVVSVMYSQHMHSINPVKNSQYYVKDAFEFLFNLSYD